MVLKTPCSDITPVFQVSVSNSNFNYFKWNDRFFTVENRIFLTNDIVEIYGTLDILSSYRTEIFNTNAYVKRSASLFNINITDTLNVPTYSLVKTTTEEELPAFNFTQNGSFIIGVVGRTNAAGGNSGFINYFNISASQLASLANSFNDNSIINDIVLSLVDVLGTIVSLFYVPFEYGSLGGSLQELYFANVDSGIEAFQLFSRFRGQSAYIRIPISIPPLEVSGVLSRNYLRTKPFTEMLLTLPFLGVVSLDPSMFYEDSSVGVEYHLDLLTGDIMYKVGSSSNAGNTLFQTFSANCYTEIPISRQTKDYLGFMNLMESIADSSGYGRVSIPLSGIVQSALGVRTTVNGTNSTALGSYLASKAQLTTIYRVPTETSTENISVRGLPCHRISRIGDLLGYCECDGASVDCTGSDSIKSRINTIVNSGFYIE